MLFRSSGRLQNGRGANEVLTLQKEGAGNVVAILKGALEVLTILEGEATKGFYPLNGEGCKNFYSVLRGGGGAQIDCDPRFSHLVVSPLFRN